MTTQPPTPEAVEAAIRWALDKGTAADHEILAGDDPYCPETDTYSRILSAEVERLRAQADAACEWNGFSVHCRIPYRTCRGVFNYT